jgi:hypothetical protein
MPRIRFEGLALFDGEWKALIYCEAFWDSDVVVRSYDELNCYDIEPESENYTQQLLALEAIERMWLNNLPECSANAVNP